MRQQAKQLDLLIPGLDVAVPADFSHVELLQAAPLLQRMLSRGRLLRGSNSTAINTLLSAGPGTAPLAYIADFNELAPSNCWRCDPVHLHADINQVFAYPARQLNISHQEAKALVSAFNAHFAEQGMQLVFADARRWYLLGLEDAEPAGPAIEQIAARDVHAYLPQVLSIKRLLTEVQMLFHDHAVNRQRQASAQLAINGIWLSGAGTIPEQVAWDGIISTATRFRGFAQYCNISCCDSVEQYITANDGNMQGLCIHSDALLEAAIEGADSWRESLHAIEHDLINPAYQALLGKQLRYINVYIGQNRMYQVAASDMKKFWRKKKEIAQLF